MTLDQYLKFAKQTRDEFKETLKADAEKKVKLTLVLEEIAKVEKVEVSDDEVEEEYKKMAELYGMDVEEIKKYITAEQTRHDVSLRKALDIIKGI